MTSDFSFRLPCRASCTDTVGDWIFRSLMKVLAAVLYRIRRKAQGHQLKMAGMEDDAKEHELSRNGTSMSTCRWGLHLRIDDWRDTVRLEVTNSVFIPVEQLERQRMEWKACLFRFCEAGYLHSSWAIHKKRLIII
jgi:hypothetical protein